MSSRKPKNYQKLGSSRRYKNRNRETEEKETDDGFQDPEKEEHEHEQSQFLTVSKNQLSDESSVLHSDQPVIACTNPNTSVLELSSQPQSQDFKDLFGQADTTKKKRKMGSTRKDRKNFQFEGIYEDEPEHRAQLSEGVIDEQVSVEASKKEDGSKEDQTSLMDSAPSQSSEQESSILQGKHLALGTITQGEDDHKNDKHQHLEAALQSKPMDISSSEVNQLKEAEFSQDLICTSVDFSSVTQTECNVPPEELDESLQIYHQMDTFSEPVATLPNPTSQASRIDTTYTPLNGNREENQDVQMSLNTVIQNDNPSMAERTLRKTTDDQSSLTFSNKDKQEDTGTLKCPSAGDIEQDEVTGVQLASLINEQKHGTEDGKVVTVICENVSTKASTADEKKDHYLEHKDETLQLTEESIYKSESIEFREDIGKYKEVSVAGDRTNNDSDEGLAATSQNQAMVPDTNSISPLKLKDKDVETSSEQVISYEFKLQGDSKIKCYVEEQNYLPEARCCTGESSADENLTKKEVDMRYDEEEKYRAIGTEREVENDNMQSADSNQLLFSKVSSTNILDFVTDSNLNPAETLYGETETSSQTCNLQHNDPDKFPTELEMQSKEGDYKVIKDRSMFLDIESEVIEEENNDTNEEINAGSTESFTKEDFIRVDDKKDGMYIFMNELEMASAITNIQDNAFTDQASMVVAEHGTESPDKGSASTIHIYPTSDSVELIPETQVELDLQVYNPIAVSDQKQNMSDECQVNLTNIESESEQFESTFPNVYIQESRLVRNDSVPENVRFSPSENNEIDSTQRILSGLRSGADQKDFKTMKETIQVHCLEESTPTSEDGKLSFTPETCYPQPSESLNIMEPEAEKNDVNLITAVVENENTNTSQVHTETLLYISTKVVNTNQEYSVLDRQDEETLVVENISAEVQTTHAVISDVVEHLVDTEVIKMQSRKEVSESIVQIEEATWEEDKDGQPIKIEDPHQNTYPDLKLEQSKSFECTEIVTVTINSDHPMTSAEPTDAAEVAQLPEANILEATTTSIQEEAFMLISSHRRKMGSIRRTLGGKKEEKVKEEDMYGEEKDLAFTDRSMLLGLENGVSKEKNNDKRKEINVGPTDDFTTAEKCTQQYMYDEISSQTTFDHHPSPATVHPDFEEDDDNSIENVEDRTAEIHRQTQTKKKKKFGSTRRPHGRHQPPEEGEWKDLENTEETEHQLITQAATSNLLTESQDTMSEVKLDIHDSPETTEQIQVITTEVETETGEIDAPPAILTVEVDHINTVVSGEVSNAERLTDIIEQNESPGVNEEKDAESIHLSEQEMSPVITKIQEDPDNECATKLNVHSTCDPLELIPETQVMSDIQIVTENIHTVVSGQDQNIVGEHLENPTNRGSEPEQLESTSSFIQTEESKSSQADKVKDNVEFNSSEKKRKTGSTRKRLKGQIPGSDQKNTFEAIKGNENIQDQNIDQKGTNTVVIEEEDNDTKEEINAGTTENFTKEDITTVCSQQYVLCELSSQTTDLGLAIIEHPSPATVRPDFKKDDDNSIENVEGRTAEIHTQTQTKKKKKFGSTRRPHGRHQPPEEGEWKDLENTEEIEHQIITQAATSNLLTEPQNTMSEVTLDIHDSRETTEQIQIIKSENETETGEIDAPPAILSVEVDHINTVVSGEVSNAERLTDIIEQNENPGVNEEKDAESIHLNEQEMSPVITKIQEDAFIEHVSLADQTHSNTNPDNECATKINVHSTCDPLEFIPETQVMSDIQMIKENIHTVVSGQDQNIVGEHLENPTNRESEPEQLESTSSFIHPDFKKDDDNSIEKVEDRTAEIHTQTQTKKKRKFGSTRRPHGRHQPPEEGEWKDLENTEETEHQIITQAATSNLLTEPQNTMSEVTLDIHDSPETTKQIQIIKSENETGTGGIDAPPAILSVEVDHINTVVSGEVSNAERLTDIIEQNEKPGVNEEKDVESIHLNEQEMSPVITKIQEDALIEHVSLADQTHSNKNPDNECASGGNVYSTCKNAETRNAEIHTQTRTNKKKKFGSTRRLYGRHQPLAEEKEGEWKDLENTEEIQSIDQASSSNLLTELQNAISELSHDTLVSSLRSEQGVECTENVNASQLADPTHGPMELVPETQARVDMPVVSEQYHTISEEPLENPKGKESKPEQCEIKCPVVHIQELKLAPDDMATQSSGDSNSGRRKKLGSTRRSLRVMKSEKENIQEQTTEESTPNSENDHTQKTTFSLTAEISHQSICEAEEIALICKNVEEGKSKQEAWQRTVDMNPRYAGDIDKEYLTLVPKEDTVNPESSFCDTKTSVQEYEPQICDKLDQSEGSLLSEIELFLNKSFESTLNTTALNPNISECSEPVAEGSLQLPSSQKPQIPIKQSSPARRRKIGSSRKMSRNKHAEKISNESKGSEQERENMDKNNVQINEPKRETKTDKETVMAEGTEDMKESVELMSGVQVFSQINESSIQNTRQPLPEGRRKFGSRRTAKGSSGLGAFTHGDYENDQEKTDIQVTKDDLRVSDPHFISEPEGTPISHLVSEPRPEIEEVRNTVVKDTNVSIEAGLVSLDNIGKTSPSVVSTGERQKIDFEQIPDFGQAVYNIVMVGNSNVGKTSFIKRLQSGHFIPDYSATIGVDTFVHTVTFGSRTVKLYVWDTAGQERYHSITRQVFHKAQGLLLMYDITSSQSFQAVRAWISQVQEKAHPDVILMLLGNKNDCAHREVQLQEGEDLSKEYNIHFMECSAATGENVSESLKALAWLLVKQRVRKEEEYTTLQPKPQNKKSGCC